MAEPTLIKTDPDSVSENTEPQTQEAPSVKGEQTQQNHREIENTEGVNAVEPEPLKTDSFLNALIENNQNKAPAQDNNQAEDDVEALQQLIAEGADPTQLLEETAAGEGEPTDGGGIYIPTIERTAEEVLADTGFDTLSTQSKIKTKAESVDVLITDTAPTANADEGVPTVTIPNDEAGAGGSDVSVVENATLTGQTFTISAPDGLATVAFDTTSFTAAQLAAASTSAPLSVTGSNGELSITDYNSSTGVVTYSYDPTGTSTNHSSGNVVDEFAVTVTDINNDTNTAASLDILITDTSPAANADIRTVGEDDTNITGNVVTGTNATADTLGADSADITGVHAGTTASEITTGVNTAVIGTYGDLTINADGSYTYVTNAAAQALNTGDTKTDTFSYTLKDSDGDFSTTTFTFTITGADEVISVLGATEGDASNSWVNAGNTNSLNAQIDYTDKGYGVSNKNGNHGNQTSAIEGNESILFDLGAEVSNANFKITLLDSSQTLTGQWIAYSQSRQEVGQGDVTGSGDVNINNLSSNFRYIEFDAHKNGNGNGKDNAFYVKPILSGDNANNSIVGDNQNNFILGGKGDDSLTGGQGDDVFIWQNNETGIDTITDWDTGTNKLDLSDLLQGETTATLDDFLNFTYDTNTSDTTLTIDVDGSGNDSDQVIVFDGVDLTQLGNDQVIIDNLLTNNQLITD